MSNPFSQGSLPVEGDPDIAIIAQVNRWVKRARLEPYPLRAPISPEVAGYAVALLQQRYASSLLQSADPAIIALIAELAAASGGNASLYVQGRRDMVLQTLARYGDSLGLPAAEYGITRRGFTWRWPVAAALALAGLGGLVMLSRRLPRRSLPA